MPARYRYLIVCLTLCVLALTARARADRTTFRPFPKAADDYWRTAVPKAMRADYISLGERYQDSAWTAIPDESFAEFRKNGNRTHYESLCFAVRTRLACLVMAEIMEHRSRFIPDICRGLHYFREQEAWWGIPAHYPMPKAERGRQVVDLFNAETAAMLAWTVYMLGSEIDTHEQGLSDSIRYEIRRRFLRPALHEKQGWKRNANNWNTWITSNWIACTLICEQDSAEQQAALQGVADCLRLFIDRYPKDGGCEEGVAYWDRAAASLFEALWTMQSSANPSLTGDICGRLQSVGRFLPAMHIRDLQFVNFSDATPFCLPNINILFPFGAYLGDADMMQLAAYIARRYNYLQHPSLLFLSSGNFPTLGRELLLLSMLPQLQATEPRQPTAADTWLENSQVMVTRNDTWLLAAKGGHNGESHNHNDVGAFILYHNGHPVFIDLGRDTYTSQTFSSRRYEMMNNRSAYHNVPLINGLEQAAGSSHKAKDVSYESNTDHSSLCMDIASAYPDSTGIRQWIQTLTLNHTHNSVSLTARFDKAARHSLQRPAKCGSPTTLPSSQTLMCYGEPRLARPGILLLQQDSVRLEYNPHLLTPAIERIFLPEGIMREQWGDKVYRLTLTLTSKAMRKGKVELCIKKNARTQKQR